MTVIVICITLQPSLPRFITPWNIEDAAGFIHSSATITNRAIHFGPGSSNEVLLVISLSCPGELQLDSSIQVTIGLDASTLIADHSLRIGLSDAQGNESASENLFYIPDVSKYSTSPPCSLLDAVHDDNRVSGIQAPAQITFVFKPDNKYGACYTAQNGGFYNSGSFNNQLDVLRGVNLILRRGDAAEEYRLFYFQVDFLQ